uniref:Uncharacterized protein n=1 Tax=Meloidogyne enterolobii TaxID=390850 RepID=A0A6V7W0L0_MELEN|nr:unnamed protein product [Meloidogyne enterolobii]
MMANKSKNDKAKQHKVDVKTEQCRQDIKVDQSDYVNEKKSQLKTYRQCSSTFIF